MAKKVIKKKAWAAFSQWYRQKNADQDGMCICYTCDCKKHWKEMQTGHLLDSRCNAILFEENGVRIQCPGCNLFKSGNKEVFIPKFIDECGREEYNRLMRLKRTVVKYSESEYARMLEDFKGRLNGNIKSTETS